VDEVLAVGDAQFQKKCLGKMGDVAHEGRTVLFVSHNMAAISELCSTAILIEAGSIGEYGSSSDVVAQYLARFWDARNTHIDNLRQPGDGQKAQFTKIELISGDGRNLAYGEPLEFRLSVTASQTLQELSIGGSVFDETGLCIGTMITDASVGIRANCRAEVTLKIRDFVLAPGRYYMGFSVGRGGIGTPRYDFDRVIGAPAYSQRYCQLHPWRMLAHISCPHQA